MRKQIALCIGNNDYKYNCLNKLDCAINDCIAISEKLTNLNFEVFCYENADRTTMHAAIDDFEARLPGYDVALFYYAGHGFECNGHNLLMPVDTNGVDAINLTARQYLIVGSNSRFENYDNGIDSHRTACFYIGE